MKNLAITWVSVADSLPQVGDKKLLVWNGYDYEIARYNEWGFHYGTRNTQDVIVGVLFWAKLPNDLKTNRK